MKIDEIEAKLLRKTLDNALRIFEKELTRPQAKAVKTVARGIVRKTTTVLAHLHEGEMRTHKFIEKISHHLGNVNLVEQVEKKAMRCVNAKLKEDEIAFISYDESDIFKPDAKKMPGLGYIRDGSTGATGNGYIMRGVNVNGISIMSYLDPVELAGMEDDPQAEKILYCLRTAMEMVNHKNSLLLMDRGSDNVEVIDGLLEKDHKFIIRARKNRKLWDGKNKKRMKITSYKPGKHQVEIEGGTSVRLHILQRKGFREPIRLYTNSEEFESETVLEYYLKRREIEKDFNKMKQLGLESVRLMSLQKVRNILALIHLVIVLAQDIYEEVIGKVNTTASGLYLYYNRWCKWKSLDMNPSSFITYLSQRIMPYTSYNVSQRADYGLFGSGRQLKKLGII